MACHIQVVRKVNRNFMKSFMKQPPDPPTHPALVTERSIDTDGLWSSMTVYCLSFVFVMDPICIARQFGTHACRLHKLLASTAASTITFVRCGMECYAHCYHLKEYMVSFTLMAIKVTTAKHLMEWLSSCIHNLRLVHIYNSKNYHWWKMIQNAHGLYSMYVSLNTTVINTRSLFTTNSTMWIQ